MYRFDRLTKLSIVKRNVKSSWYITLTRNGHSLINYEDEIPLLFKGIITSQKYYAILRKHGAKKQNYSYFFDSFDDADNALKELEKYIVAAMLVGE